MSSDHILLLLALLLPLTLDTFLVSTALGVAGLPKKHRLRTSLILALFEAVMPAIGVLLGHGLADAVGHYAGYIAGAVIGLAGLLLLKPSDRQEDKKAKLLARTHGFAIINLGISISIDEVALGLSLGLLGIPLLLAVIPIGLQAFIASQLGLRLGERLNVRFRQNAEKIAGSALIILAMVVTILYLSGHKP
jgi:putative Mn2+ efflux pump MntP